MPIIGDENSRARDRRDQRREIKAMLKAALNDMNVKMTSRHDYSSVGLQYTEKFTSYMEVLSAMSLLPWHQREALVRNLGQEKATQEQIGATLGVSRKTVCEYIRDGLEAMQDRIYEN